MLIDSSIAQAYIESSCVDAFRASWLFEHTSVSSDLGRNAFTPPPEDLALRETVRKLERRICEAAAHFVPVNRPIWDALFPDWAGARGPGRGGGGARGPRRPPDLGRAFPLFLGGTADT